MECDIIAINAGKLKDQHSVKCPVFPVHFKEMQRTSIWLVLGHEIAAPWKDKSLKI